MSAGEFTNGHKPRNGLHRARQEARAWRTIILHTKLKVKNRRLLSIIKHERKERAALLEKVRHYQKAAARAEAEIAMLKAQLGAVKSALNQTSTVIEEGLASFHLAKLRFQELNEGINQDYPNLGPFLKDTVAAVNEPSTSAGTTATPGTMAAINEPSTSSVGTTATMAMVPPPKLQARVNPMIQGVPLMSPSIMLQRLQPDDLERQLSSSQRAVSATTPVSPTVDEASVPTLTGAVRISQRNGLRSPGGPNMVHLISVVDPGTQGDPAVSSLRRSSRLRRM